MKKSYAPLAVRNVIAPPTRPTLLAATLLATVLSLPVAVISLISLVLSG